MLAELLSRSGYNVVATAEDGAKGFDLIMRHQPDAALLDIGLPKLDGYQLARKVRQELGGSIRLIALTGYGRDEDHEAVLEAGFNEQEKGVQQFCRDGRSRIDVHNQHRRVHFWGREERACRDVRCDTRFSVDLHAERQQAHITWTGADSFGNFFLDG